MDSTKSIAMLLKIEAKKPSLSKSEQRVCDYIIQHPEEIIYLSVSELAERSGVSDATVIRASQKLGSKSYQDLKISLAQDIVTPLQAVNEEIAPDDRPAAVVEKFAAFAAEGLPVWCVGGTPDRTTEGEMIDWEIRSLFREVTLEDLADEIRLAHLSDMAFVGTFGEDLRAYHYSRNGGHVLLLTNEGILGAVDGTSRVREFRGGGLVRMELADEGQGMTKRQRKKAFDRYYRSRTVLESGKGGFGIGLCTAREFAVAMKGTLTVKSNSPQGCVFTLELPAA